MEKYILASINDSLSAVSQLKHPRSLAFMANVATTMAHCFQAGGKVIVAGNGGSMCDASHFAEELTGVFRTLRRALPAIALSDSGHITCVANDLGFDQVFARGVQAYGAKGDVFLGLTTSGNSSNLIEAFKTAKEKELITVSLLGKSGGQLKGQADFELIIEDMPTSDRIQEAHMTALHIIIEMIEKQIFFKEEKNACDENHFFLKKQESAAVPAEEFEELQNGAKEYSPGSGNPGGVTQPWVKKWISGNC